MFLLAHTMGHRLGIQQGMREADLDAYLGTPRVSAGTYSWPPPRAPDRRRRRRWRSCPGATSASPSEEVYVMLCFHTRANGIYTPKRLFVMLPTAACRESVGTVLEYSPWRGGGRRRGSRRRWRPAARRAPRSTTDGDAPASSLSLLPLLTLWWPALRASLSKRNELVCADQPLSLSLEISLGAFHLLPLCALVQCKLERRDRLLYVRKVPGRTVNRCQRGRLAACCCIYNNERGGWQWPHRRENISADRDGEKGGEDRRSLAKRREGRGQATEPKKYLASGTFSSGRKKPTILPRCSVGWPRYFERSMVCVAPVALSWARGLGLGIYAHLVNPPRESVDPAIDGSNTYV
jgi:hypothetical protein